MTTRSPIDAGDSGYVIRVTRHVQYPADHMFLDSREPLPIIHHARDMTLARGRILYEVTYRDYTSARGVSSLDQERHVVIGYVLPSSILREAIDRGRKSGSLGVAYAHLSQQERNAFFGAHRTVLEKFPRIDETAARIIAERLTSHGYQLPISNIEKAVVDHVGYMWTSYRFRSEQGQTKEFAKEAIKPRSREVLMRWLPRDIPFEQFEDLWQHWDLLDAPKRPDRFGESIRDEEVFRPSNAMTYFAGKQTVANLVCKPQSFL